MGKAACPSVNTLKNNLENTMPFLNGGYIEWSGKRKERLQVDGNVRHQTGLCLDIILFAADKIKGGAIFADKTLDWEKEKILGEHIVKALVDYRREMNWTEIIYQDVIFKQSPDSQGNYNPGHYGNDCKHFTHIHIDWMDNGLKGKGLLPASIPWSSQANLTMFSGVLSARLKEVYEKWEKGYLSSMTLMNI